MELPEDTQMQAGREGEDTFNIPSNMLPPALAQKVQKGTKLEFEAMGPPDAQGDIPVKCTYHGDEESSETWEDRFRSEMSPRSDDESPEVPGETY